jgi:hypothetical protein
MTNLTVPVDGRKQYNELFAQIANVSLGREPNAGLTRVGYGSGKVMLDRDVYRPSASAMPLSMGMADSTSGGWTRSPPLA